MSAEALQDALITALLADSSVSALAGTRVYDNAPSGASYPYITLGPYQEIPDDAECIEASEAYQQIDVWTQEAGSQRGCKALAHAVKKALHGADLALSEGAVVLVEVESWSVQADPEEFVAHGIVNVKVLTED